MDKTNNQGLKKSQKTNAAYGLGILAAIGASLCCITPILALVAGASGLASSLSWLAPLRPWFIGLAVVALGYAWYRSLKAGREDCADGSCKTEKKSFLSSRTSLVIFTIAAVLLITFPFYAGIFYSHAQQPTLVATNKGSIRTAQFRLAGMSCKACEQEVNSELYKVNGVIDAKTSYGEGQSIVKYDTTKTVPEQLKEAIGHTGYKVISYQINQ